MFYLAVLLSIPAGAAIATIGHFVPRRAAALETCGGVLLVGGLVLLGAALPTR